MKQIKINHELLQNEIFARAICSKRFRLLGTFGYQTGGTDGGDDTGKYELKQLLNHKPIYIIYIYLLFYINDLRRHITPPLYSDVTNGFLVKMGINKFAQSC